MSSPSKPNHIDLGDSRSFQQPPRFPGTPPAELPPPRTGDAPPALSPLDAFALQGQLLASRFDEEHGRRISRLPHFMIANEFQRSRQGHFSPINNQSPISPDDAAAPGSITQPAFEPSGTAPEVSRTSDRHRSYYPHIQSFDDAASIRSNDIGAPDRQPLQSVSEERTSIYSARGGRSESPDPYGDPRYPQDNPYLRNEFIPGPPSKSSTNDSLRSISSLVPPSYAFSDISRSPRIPTGPPPLRGDSGDDSDSRSIRSETNELRPYPKGPLGNLRDRPRSPFSPPLHARRSPSISSEISNPDVAIQPRRSVNFSRPMSPAARLHRPSVDSRPSFELSTRTLQVDGADVRDTGPSIDVLSLQESIHDTTPVGPRPFANDDFNGNLTDDESAVAIDRANGPENSSYTYARYALPRGRKVMSRTSMAAADWLASKFDWDQASAERGQAPPDEDEAQPKRQPTLEQPTIEEKSEPQSRPSTSKGFKGRFVEVMDDDDSPTPGLPQGISHPDLGIHIVPPTPAPDANTVRSRSFDEVRAAQPGSIKKQKSVSNMTKSAASTPTERNFPEIPTLHPKGKGRDRDRGKAEYVERQESFDTNIPLTPTNQDQMSAEQHLAKGIASHEEGALQKSTYHLRLASRAGHPTAMLLYALACRHGWGMRPNQAEGLNWLRRAVDLSKLEVGNDQLLKGPNMGGTPSQTDALAKKAHKAQLALSIYELGISYMNGWGIATDKVLALRCFEIAGGWGDADAMAEAGFCYAKGVGCKKDLFKAAEFYRSAEAKGISMAGNSWIYKDKYLPKEEGGDDRKSRSADKDEKKKKPRDKSRTRTFFGGKKKVAADSSP